MNFWLTLPEIRCQACPRSGTMCEVVFRPTAQLRRNAAIDYHGENMKLLPALCFTAALLAQTWAPQTSNTRASLRGVSAVDARSVWASGSGGAWLVTTDGGVTWRAAKVPGAETLDFRGIRAIDARTVYLMSAGSGDQSRIYKTSDAGATGRSCSPTPIPKASSTPSLSGMRNTASWSATQSTAAPRSSPPMTAAPPGSAATRPRALPNEGSFAASNTCLTLFGKHDAWFATGGPGAARVFHSRDRGLSWTVAATPIRNDSPSAGIFSLAFADARHGIAVGGDYSKDTEDRQNIALTSDGGRTWSSPPGPAPKASVPPSLTCPAASCGSSPAPPVPTSPAMAAKPGSSSIAALTTP